MPEVAWAHLDARRQQILDAARARFASHGFARTSVAGIVTGSGLSNGAIYRYFTSKDEIVVAVCEQAGDAFPAALTAEARAVETGADVSCGRRPMSFAGWRRLPWRGSLRPGYCEGERSWVDL
jgi:AcrR family transcriptional regulator